MFGSWALRLVVLLLLLAGVSMARDPAPPDGERSRSPVVLSPVVHCEPQDVQVPALPSNWSALPVVSLVVPTFERPTILLSLLDDLAQQQYPWFEVVVVDDSAECVSMTHIRPMFQAISHKVPAWRPEVQHQYHCVRDAGGALSVGAKRHFAVTHAHGEYVMHWDDDDVHHPWRIWYQIQPLLRDEADIAVLSFGLFVVLPTRVPPPGGESPAEAAAADSRLTCYWAKRHGHLLFATMAYRRAAYLGAPTVRYPDTSLAEDVYLLQQLGAQAQEEGAVSARFGHIDNGCMSHYVRHSSATYPLNLDEEADGQTECADWVDRAKLAVFRRLLTSPELTTVRVPVNKVCPFGPDTGKLPADGNCR